MATIYQIGQVRSVSTGRFPKIPPVAPREMNRVQLDDAVGAVRNLISRDAIELLIKFQRDYRAKHKREATDAELAAEAERMIRTHGAK